MTACLPTLVHVSNVAAISGVSAPHAVHCKVTSTSADLLRQIVSSELAGIRLSGEERHGIENIPVIVSYRNIVVPRDELGLVLSTNFCLALTLHHSCCD